MRLVDIRDYMPSRWLTTTELERRGGSYAGTILQVVEQSVRNRFTGRHDVRPVIVFDDGAQLIPNVAMMRALAQLYGNETAGWHARSIRVFLRRVERTDQQTGEVRARFERAVMAVGDVNARPVAVAADTDGLPTDEEVFGERRRASRVDG